MIELNSDLLCRNGSTGQWAIINTLIDEECKIAKLDSPNTTGIPFILVIFVEKKIKSVQHGDSQDPGEFSQIEISEIRKANIDLKTCPVVTMTMDYEMDRDNFNTKFHEAISNYVRNFCPKVWRWFWPYTLPEIKLFNVVFNIPSICFSSCR